MDEGKFWLTLWIGVSFFVTLLILGALYFDKSKTVELAKLGYEKTTIAGHAAAVYQKRCCNDPN